MDELYTYMTSPEDYYHEFFAHEFYAPVDHERTIGVVDIIKRKVVSLPSLGTEPNLTHIKHLFTVCKIRPHH